MPTGEQVYSLLSLRRRINALQQSVAQGHGHQPYPLPSTWAQPAQLEEGPSPNSASFQGQISPSNSGSSSKPTHVFEEANPFDLGSPFPDLSRVEPIGVGQHLGSSNLSQLVDPGLHNQGGSSTLSNPMALPDVSFLDTWPFWLANTNSQAVSPESGLLQNALPLPPQPTYVSTSNEIDWLADSYLIPAIACFFERLHPIMPVFTRSYLLDRIDRDEHHTQSGFAAMLLALSALSKIQAIGAVDKTTRSQNTQASRLMLEKSARMRASSTMGSNHTLDDVLASFYTFATLFGLQEHSAATFRL